MPLGRAQLEDFPDGEISLKLHEDVRGRDVFVIQSTCTPPDHNLMELPDLHRLPAACVGAADHGSDPVLWLRRQDRKDEGRVPITAKLVANLLTTAGATRVLTCDLHAAQIQGSSIFPWTTSRLNR